MNERERLSSRLGFILLSAGCAIGIGNVWKFPYITGQNGGAIFVLVYTILGGFLAESASDFMQAIVMICALTVCGSYYFLTAALCGGYYVRAELSTVKVPGGKEFFDQGSENKKQYHGIVAFIIILTAAFLHSWNVTGALIAALTAWLIAWYSISLCTETEQGMSCNAQRVTGYGTEMILLLEGTLICFRG